MNFKQFRKSKKELDNMEIFYTPSHNSSKKNKLSYFQKLKQKLMPSMAIFGSGVTIGIGTYGLLSGAYWTFNSIMSYFGSYGLADIITGVSYAAATLYGLYAALLFKNYYRNPDKEYFSKPIIYSVIAFILLVLPHFLSQASVATFSSPSQNSSYFYYYSLFDFFTFVSYILGFGLGIKSGLMFKYAQNKTKTLIQASVFGLCSAILVSLPSLLSVSGGTTVWGNSEIVDFDAAPIKTIVKE